MSNENIITASNIAWGLYPKKLSIQCKSKKSQSKGFYRAALGKNLKIIKFLLTRLQVGYQPGQV